MTHQPGDTWTDHLGVKTQTCQQCRTTRQISDDGLRNYPWNSGPECRGTATQGPKFSRPAPVSKPDAECTEAELEAKRQELADLFGG